MTFDGSGKTIDLQGVASFASLVELLSQELGVPAGRMQGQLPSGPDAFNQLIGEIDMNSQGFTRSTKPAFRHKMGRRAHCQHCRRNCRRLFPQRHSRTSFTSGPRTRSLCRRYIRRARSHGDARIRQQTLRHECTFVTVRSF